MPEFHQIGGQPAQKDPEAIDVGKIGTHDRPHIGRSEQGPPRHVRRLLDFRLVEVTLFVDPADMFEFGSVHEPVLLRQVAVGKIPPEGPEHADRGADVEHPLPPERRHDQHHDRRRNGCSEATRAVGDPLAEATLLPRIPELHGAGCSRKCAGFADTEQKTNDHE